MDDEHRTRMTLNCCGLVIYVTGGSVWGAICQPCADKGAKLTPPAGS